jgi:hypothetical protein
MSAKKIADYRRRVGHCLSQAQLTSVANARLLWLTMAQDWQVLAENAERIAAQCNRARRSPPPGKKASGRTSAASARPALSR